MEKKFLLPKEFTLKTSAFCYNTAAFSVALMNGQDKSFDDPPIFLSLAMGVFIVLLNAVETDHQFSWGGVFGMRRRSNCWWSTPL
jgi:hypothetical protein